jgi:Sugar-tranasporters, 12 TM
MLCSKAHHCPHIVPPCSHSLICLNRQWFVCAVGDWLQGPYVYALYEKYGYSPAQIGQLFIAGFGASLVVGTFVGAAADRMCASKLAHTPCVCLPGACVHCGCCFCVIVMFYSCTEGPPPHVYIYTLLPLVNIAPCCC